jgi:hypothetical protein
VQYPWYDSLWLSAYVLAKDFVAENHPQKLQEFVGAFNVFRTRPDYKIKHLPRLFDDETITELKQIMSKLEFDDKTKGELMSFGRFVEWNLPYATSLQEQVTDLVGDIVGEPVEPCYNFLSLYKELGVCRVHMDAPFAKWTVDLCIEQSDVWPIHFSKIVSWPEDWQNPGEGWEDQIKNDPSNEFESFEMREGEAVIFSGSSQWHYRNSIERVRDTNFCHLLFFHFIPAGTSALTKPANWKDLFDIPELAGLENSTNNPDYVFS